MKGYILLTVIVSVILLSFPPLLLKDDTTEPAVAVKTDDVQVKHSDSEQISMRSIVDLTVYETAAQISWEAPIEAIKAQALSCYTLLCYQALSDNRVESTCLSFPEEYTESYWKERLGEQYENAIGIYKDAVLKLNGKQIRYNELPIMALSHFMNSGMTENGTVLLGQELPYFQSVASPADTVAVNQLQTVTVPVSDAVQKLSSVLGTAPPADTSQWFGNVQKTAAGVVENIALCGEEISGKNLQELFGLPSAAFEVGIQGEQVIFTVRGQGHFVGLSTTGAIAMAKDGQTCEQIVKHYYTGVTVS